MPRKTIYDYKPKDWREAGYMIVEGTVWYAKHKKLVLTSALAVLTLIGWEIGAIGWLTRPSLGFEKAEPIRISSTPSGLLGLGLIPEAYAQTTLKTLPNVSKLPKNAIILDGAYYGKEDTSWRVYAVEGETQKVLVYDMTTAQVSWSYMLLDREKLNEQLKK